MVMQHIVSHFIMQALQITPYEVFCRAGHAHAAVVGFLSTFHETVLEDVVVHPELAKGGVLKGVPDAGHGRVVL